jgi:uncharacterized protein involved in type VI secretion and phage assembly
MSDGTRYYGKYRATVLNNVDTENRGRVQVQLADRYGLFPSTWAMPSFPVASIQHGICVIPPIHASVWIEFEAGDLDFPVWSGGFFENAGEMPALAAAGTPATPNIVMQTTGQVTLLLSDNPLANVLIKSASGAMIQIGSSGILISNGQGAVISLSGPTVSVNNGALTVT